MDGLCRSTRDAPPSHFIFKIESFSTLSSSSTKRYESSEFSGSDYKWKLALYPNGNETRDGKDHISLYLILSDSTCLQQNKEIQVAFTLFLFDHIREKYLSVHGFSRFYALKSESGFDKFLPLKIFNDPSSGYLVNDTCMFGAEVFLVKTTTKGQCLSMVKPKPAPLKYTWKMESFLQLFDKEYFSGLFTVGGCDWKMSLYPKGRKTGKGNSLSFFLYLADSKTALPTAGSEVLAEFKLRVVDQVNGKHKELTCTNFFGTLSLLNVSWGWDHFLPLSHLNQTTGYLVNDVCILEAEIVVQGTAKIWG